jgi:hypothetical protein
LSRTGPGGWVRVDEHADRLKSEWNGFDPARYGHGSLSELARADGRLFQADPRPVKNAGPALHLRPAADEPRPAELPVEFLRETLAALSRGGDDGWVRVGEHAAWLKRDRRGFDAADYGRPAVAGLVLANGRLFLTAWRGLKQSVPVLFVRPDEDAPTTGGRTAEVFFARPAEGWPPPGEPPALKTQEREPLPAEFLTDTLASMAGDAAGGRVPLNEFDDRLMLAGQDSKPDNQGYESLVSLVSSNRYLFEAEGRNREENVGIRYVRLADAAPARRPRPDLGTSRLREPPVIIVPDLG